MKTLLIAILLSLALVTARAQTNLDHVPNLLGISATNLEHVVNDAGGVLANFDYKTASAGVIAFKAPDGYGLGIALHTVNTNNPVQIGFGLFGAQENNSVTGARGWAFYDASLSIGLSTTETIPILGWPIRLMIESGPAFKISGEGSGGLLEQSAAYGDLDFKLTVHLTLEAGAGVIHCSDSHFANKAMPMAHLNLNWSF